MRLVNGEIQIIPYGNAMKSDCSMGVNSTEWKAIKPDGTLVEPGTVGTLKIDGTSQTSSPRINTSVTVATTDEGNSYLRNQYFKSVEAVTGVSIPKILIAAGLFPETGMTSPGGYWARNNGEKLPIRGSSFGGASGGGVAALDLLSARSFVGSYVSFRSAFYE